MFRSTYSQLQILFIISIFLQQDADAQRAQRARLRVCSAVMIPNANIRFRHNNKIMRINCAPGFTLQGSNYVGCESGKWNAVFPVCTKEGCTKPQDPPNGIVLASPLIANLYCKDKYMIAGGKATYCNGTHWDRPLGECREATNGEIRLACDFETEDLCGWSHEETHNFDWKRVMAANLFQQLRTGPQHDHTTLTSNSGHYMLMESFDQPQGSVARLISPIFSKQLTGYSACFKFYYFMYGATVGSLNVYVKPLSVDIDQLLQESRYLYFSLSGNQNSSWKEAVFTIEQMQEDFQIIIEGTAGSNHLSDIAIDDTKLLTYSECNAFAATSISKEPDQTEISEDPADSIITLATTRVSVSVTTQLLPTDSVISTTDSSDGKTYVATTQRTAYRAMSIGSTTPYSTTSTKLMNTSTAKGITADSTPFTKLPTTTFTTTTSTTTTSTTFSSHIFEKSTIESIASKIFTPSLPYFKLTSEGTPINRNDKVITWKIDRKLTKESLHPAWLIFAISVAVPAIILFVIFVIKHFVGIRKARLHHFYRYSSAEADSSDTATLTYK